LKIQLFIEFSIQKIFKNVFKISFLKREKEKKKGSPPYTPFLKKKRKREKERYKGFELS